MLVKLREALQNSDDPVRRRQLAGWKVFKGVEPVQGNILYLFLINPSVPDANYAISIILNEAFPAEVQGLYERIQRGVQRRAEHHEPRARRGLLRRDDLTRRWTGVGGGRGAPPPSEIVVAGVGATVRGT